MEKLPKNINSQKNTKNHQNPYVLPKSTNFQLKMTFIDYHFDKK